MPRCTIVRRRAVNQGAGRDGGRKSLVRSKCAITVVLCAARAPIHATSAGTLGNGLLPAAGPVVGPASRREPVLAGPSTHIGVGRAGFGGFCNWHVNAIGARRDIGLAWDFTVSGTALCRRDGDRWFAGPASGCPA